MIGFPKHLNTQEDYLNCRDMVLSGDLNAEPLRVKLQALLDTQKHHVFDRVLADIEKPTGPEPDYRVVEVKKEDGSTERHQFALTDDANCTLVRLGFTADEVNALLAEIGE